MIALAPILRYLVLILHLLLWTGLLLFFLSQFVRFNFPKAFLTVSALLILILVFSPARPAAFNWVNADFVIRGIVPLVLFPVFMTFFITLFEYRGFGPGVSLARENPEPDILLTFDDGPSAKWTGELVKILVQHNAQGIFFVCGAAARKHPETVRLLRDSGMEIGVHTENHRPLPFLPTKQIEEEIDRTIEAIRAAGGEPPRYFRPPWGMYNREVLEIARSRNLEVLLWTRSTKDWQGIPEKAIVKNAVERVKPHEVILLHDGHKEGLSRENTAIALPYIIDEIRRLGFTCAPLKKIDEAQTAG